MFDDNRDIGTVSRRGESEFARINENLRQYMIAVFNYMLLGLVVTGAVAYYVSSSMELMNAIFTTPLLYVVLFAPFGFVLALSFGIDKISSGTAQVLFWAYSATVGLSLSSIFIIYSGMSIAKVFFITASMFGSMSLYGYTTKKDLTSWGSMLFMALIGLIIASLVNMFAQSDGFSYIISFVTVIIFTGLTAYDVQKIKHMYYHLSDDEEMLRKSAIIGALRLYLDFINIFLSLLRLMGSRR